MGHHHQVSLLWTSDRSQFSIPVVAEVVILMRTLPLLCPAKNYGPCVFIPSSNKQNLASVFDYFFSLSSTHMCTHDSSSICRHSQAHQLSPCLPFRHAKGMKDHEKKYLILNRIFLFHMRRAREKVKAETCSYIVRKSNKFLQRTPGVTCGL